MKTKVFLLTYFFLVIIGFNTKTFSQDKEVVLVNGNPPLTQLMVGKTIVLLDWMLDLKLTKQQELQIKDILVASWKQNSKEKIKSTTDIIELYEEIFLLSESERNKIKEKLKPRITENLFKESNDELSKIIITAYNSSHAASPINDAVQSKPNNIQKNNQRLGADGFTGIHRMLRPKALNINNLGYENGFTIEYITFFPDGHLYWSLPPEGLLYYDPVVAKRASPDDWGTYEIKNGEIHVLRGPQKYKYIITRTGDRLNNPESLGKGSFRYIPTSDGLRLDGNYRRWEGEPTITFTKDGRFTDGGTFKNFGDMGRLDGSVYKDDGIGGSGTYIINQNTLELKYSDGRIKRHVFIAFPEDLVDKPAVKKFLLYEQRMERY